MQSADLLLFQRLQRLRESPLQTRSEESFVDPFLICGVHFDACAARARALSDALSGLKSEEALAASGPPEWALYASEAAGAISLVEVVRLSGLAADPEVGRLVRDASAESDEILSALKAEFERTRTLAIQYMDARSLATTRTSDDVKVMVHRRPFPLSDSEFELDKLLDESVERLVKLNRRRSEVVHSTVDAIGDSLNSPSDEARLFQAYHRMLLSLWDYYTPIKSESSELEYGLRDGPIHNTFRELGFRINYLGYSDFVADTRLSSEILSDCPRMISVIADRHNDWIAARVSLFERAAKLGVFGYEVPREFPIVQAGFLQIRRHSHLDIEPSGIEPVIGDEGWSFAPDIGDTDWYDYFQELSAIETALHDLDERYEARFRAIGCDSIDRALLHAKR